MIVTILGKEQKSGIYNEKEYCNNMVHCSYKKAGFEGVCVEVVKLKNATYPYDTLEVGKQYNVDRGSRGEILAFTRA